MHKVLTQLKPDSFKLPLSRSSINFVGEGQQHNKII